MPVSALASFVKLHGEVPPDSLQTLPLLKRDVQSQLKGFARTTTFKAVEGAGGATLGERRHLVNETLS